MNILTIIGDVQKTYQDALPLPVWTDRAALKAWTTKVKDDGIDLVFDAGGWSQVKAALCAATPGELQAAGNHPFLQKLWAGIQSLPWSTILPLILPLLLKAPAPADKTP